MSTTQKAWWMNSIILAVLILKWNTGTPVSIVCISAVILLLVVNGTLYWTRKRSMEGTR